MLKLNYFLADIFILSAEKQPIKLSWRKIEWLRVKANEAIVVENAPLGVRAGVAAGIFTVAVNTGPLPDKVLLDEGANYLFHSMSDFSKNWKDFYQAIK